ncbi:MAG TPA: DEAD/DEAH box helicase, partial [Ktedonobacteraceae bacterium]|nr:DEAD/DEAH box helicase [Ktedonobacteraceae bacterium]
MDEQVGAKPEGAAQEIEADLSAFAARYPFPIDAFQLEAMQHLAHGRSVLVTAPTGTGKTLVAEYAIWRARQHNQRVIYTTPLKALSNQKYRDLCNLYGSEAVGLVTGDIVEHSKASIVIMTTEVYRNMLLEEGAERFTGGERTTPVSLADVGYIVFDELHYLSDAGRGPVWEEAIICSPPTVQLVGLSATASNAEDLAEWISRVHRPVSLVVHTERAVPLEHFYFLDNKLHMVMDANGQRIERFPNIGGETRLAMSQGRNRRYRFGEEEETQENAIAQGENGTDQEATSEKKPAHPKPHKTAEPGDILSALREANLLPTLYFLPGRKVVEEAALSAARHLFTTPEEAELLRQEVSEWLEHLPPEDRNLQQVHALTDLLPRGLGFHHAGLLPALKVLVETLFARGHLRAVFATDTLALGINMPARSVVVGSLSKFDGQEMRLLTPNEYSQLTGRAGRRGMDIHGSAIIPYSPWEPFEPAFARITDELHPVISSFAIRYNSVLNLWRPGDTRHLRRICASSLREYQRYILWEQREMQRLQKLEGRQQKARKSGKKKGLGSQGAAAALEKRRQKIGAYPLSRAGAAELDGTIYALRALNYINPQDQLTLAGQLLRSIFHPSGILLVDMVLMGVLDDLNAAELAEVCSWFTYDNDRRLNNRNVLNNKLVQVRRDLWSIVQSVHRVEEQAQLPLSPTIVPEFHGIALAWARGMSLSGLLRRIDMAEGDLLMLLNQTIDLLQQLQTAVGHALDLHSIWEPELPADSQPDQRSHTARQRAEQHAERLKIYRTRLEHLRPLFAQAGLALKRGIILQSRTVPSMIARVEE